VRKLDRTHTLYGRGQRLSDAEIVAMYAETKDSLLVATKAGVSSTTVLSRVRAAGGEVFQRGHGRTYPHIKLKCGKDEICRLYQEGVSGPELADRAGCSTSQIYIILKACNIERRRATDYAYKLKAAQRRAATGGA
jgi:hypothetical protein